VVSSSIFLSIFLLFSSPSLSRRRLDVYHTFHTWCGLSSNLGCRSETCCTRLAENIGRKQSPSTHHRTTLSGYIFATKARIDNRKKTCLLNSNISPTCLHNMVNVCPLAAEIGSVLWGAPANFNGFRVLASFLQRRRSMEANQTLHDVWPSPGLVHYIYIFGGSCPVTEFYHVKNSLSVQVSRCPILAALLHSTRVMGVCQTNFAALSRGRHLHPAGQPSRWALATFKFVFLHFARQRRSTSWMR